MAFISDFADQAVMLPMAVAVLLLLLAMGWTRGAAAWLGAVGSVFATIALLKAGFVLLSEQFGSEYRISPSGHAASACVVYGGLVVLLLRGAVPSLLVAALPVAAAAAIGYSRVALGAHTPAEVAMGLVIGTAGLAGLALTAGERPRLVAWPLATAGLGVAVLLHGLHLPAEQMIRTAALSW